MRLPSVLTPSFNDVEFGEGGDSSLFLSWSYGDDVFSLVSLCIRVGTGTLESRRRSTREL